MVNQPLGLEIFAFGFSSLKVNLRKRTLMFRDVWNKTAEDGEQKLEGKF